VHDLQESDSDRLYRQSFSSAQLILLKLFIILRKILPKVFIVTSLAWANKKRTPRVGVRHVG
jgi:hypothetical protein